MGHAVVLGTAIFNFLTLLFALLSELGQSWAALIDPGGLFQLRRLANPCSALFSSPS